MSSIICGKKKLVPNPPHSNNYEITLLTLLVVLGSLEMIHIYLSTCSHVSETEIFPLSTVLSSTALQCRRELYIFFSNCVYFSLPGLTSKTYPNCPSPSSFWDCPCLVFLCFRNVVYFLKVQLHWLRLYFSLLVIFILALFFSLILFSLAFFGKVAS